MTIVVKPCALHINTADWAGAPAAAAIHAEGASMLLLSTTEIEELTGYKRPCDQLRELHRQGFCRGRRDRLGRVVLERAHYLAVCGMEQQSARPRVKRQAQRPAA